MTKTKQTSCINKLKIIATISLIALSACQSTQLENSDYLEAKRHLDSAQLSIEQLDALSSQQESTPNKKELMSNFLKETHSATPVLERLATKNNAWAQYRLGLALTVPFTPPEERSRSCPLFKKSASQGYLPAIYALAGMCSKEITQVQLILLLEQSLNDSEKFDMYYPTPAMIYRRCHKNMPYALAMPSLTKSAFEAEAYFDLSMATPAKTPEKRQKRLAYLEAAKNRDCPAAQTHIDNLLSIK
ncbi:hypothetical protein DFO61_3620 [Ectopseudomonas oleovorans]|uniref:Lipoprotein n=1 Tax=Ectopseudomonas oleovorans TaxID=301 RepID=A0A397M834_ECTOL|nr:hypothetical protein [Pseudomonas oleovorans]RIA21200.1 hypothetical protein DFO61_3620 [Pseudomonas oleovorans]